MGIVLGAFVACYVVTDGLPPCPITLPLWAVVGAWGGWFMGCLSWALQATSGKCWLAKSGDAADETRSPVAGQSSAGRRAWLWAVSGVTVVYVTGWGRAAELVPASEGVCGSKALFGMNEVAPELFRLVMLACPLLCGWLAMEALVYARLRLLWQRLNLRDAAREAASAQAGLVDRSLAEDSSSEDSSSGESLAESLGWQRFGAWAISVWMGPLALVAAAVAIHDGVTGLAMWEPVRSALSLSVCFAVCLLGVDGGGRLLGRRCVGESVETPEWLSRGAALAGVPCPPLIRWGDSAGPRLVALWGLTPGGSSIWFSQTAWRSLDEAEQGALGLHELAHLALLHPLRRAVWLLMSVALAAGVLGLVRSGSSVPGPGLALAMLATAGLTSVVGLGAFAGYARVLELAADRQAVTWLCRMAAGDGEMSWLVWREQVELYLRALGKLTGAERGGWCHPSWSERRRHLLRVGVPRTRSLA